MAKRFVSKRKSFSFAGLALIFALLLYAYFTADQANSVGWSETFTIDTQDSVQIAQPVSTIAEDVSGFFPIDTQDAKSVAQPNSYTLVFSSYFTIDTQEPDSFSRPLSLGTEAVSVYFTIDTMLNGPVFLESSFFAIDSRDSDSSWRSFSLAASESSDFYIIDTLDPPPEDSDNDGLHDFWELTNFGPNLLLTDGTIDWDYDRFSNFAEFAFGMNPKIVSPSPIRDYWVETSGGQSWFYLRYSRHVLAVRMVDYYVDVSNTLSDWEDATAQFEEVGPVENEGGAIELVAIRHPLESPLLRRKFFRLRAERKP